MNRNINVTLECFVKKDDKYLMLRRSPTKKVLPNTWMAPGGKREFNEGLFSCARREVREETGVEITNLQIKVTGCAYIEDIDQEFFFHLLVAEYESGEVLQDSPDGKLEWLSVEEMMKLENLLPELKHLLPHIVSDNPQTISCRAVYKNGKEMTSFEIEDVK